jgi:hypothetical protein
MDFPIGMVAPHQDFNPQCVDHHACVNPPGSIDLKVPPGAGAGGTRIYRMGPPSDSVQLPELSG